MSATSGSSSPTAAGPDPCRWPASFPAAMSTPGPCLRLFVPTVVLALAVRAAEAPPLPHEFGGATPLQWSVRMADAEMARRGDSLVWRDGGSAKWDYTVGLFTLSLVRLAECLDEIEPADRRLLEAKYLDGTSVRELSAETGLTEKAVESRLGRLRRHLRGIMLNKLRAP